jgi:hypothetical protein
MKNRQILEDDYLVKTNDIIAVYNHFYEDVTKEFKETIEQEVTYRKNYMRHYVTCDDFIIGWDYMYTNEGVYVNVSNEAVCYRFIYLDHTKNNLLLDQ